MTAKDDARRAHIAALTEHWTKLLGGGEMTPGPAEAPTDTGAGILHVRGTRKRPSVFATLGASLAAAPDGRHLEAMMIAHLREPEHAGLMEGLLRSFWARMSTSGARYDEVVPANAEFVRATKMEGALVLKPIALDPAATTLPSSPGFGPLELVWLLPIYRSEAEVVLLTGAKTLLNLLSTAKVDVFSFPRPALTAEDTQRSAAATHGVVHDNAEVDSSSGSDALVVKKRGKAKTQGNEDARQKPSPSTKVSSAPDQYAGSPQSPSNASHLGASRATKSGSSMGADRTPGGRNLGFRAADADVVRFALPEAMRRDRRAENPNLPTVSRRRDAADPIESAHVDPVSGQRDGRSEGDAAEQMRALAAQKKARVEALKEAAREAERRSEARNKAREHPEDEPPAPSARGADVRRAPIVLSPEAKQQVRAAAERRGAPRAAVQKQMARQETETSDAPAKNPTAPSSKKSGKGKPRHRR